MLINRQEFFSLSEQKLDNYYLSSGRVLWLTGLSGAGKTTLAKLLQQKLSAHNVKALIFDGDQVREAINDPYWQYDMESRLKGSYRYSKLAALAANQGHTVIVPTISMFHEVQKWNKDNLPGYFEVHLKTSKKIREHRDSKVLYRDYQSGNNSNMVGLDIQPEEPISPDFVVENNGTIECLSKVCEQLLAAFFNKPLSKG